MSPSNERGPEQALVFPGGSGGLVGILHGGNPDAVSGVVIVVGGPQYRVGSHRQFVLLARHLSSAGVPVLRFDYNGMGDSAGGAAHFEACGADIRAAVDTLVARYPTLRHVVLWGLCDGASAAMMYAPSDPRVSGLVLLNPWVRTEEGLAKARLKHYYLQRLGDPAFWKKLLSGRLNPFTALSSLAGIVRSALAGGGRGGASARGEAARVDHFKADGPLPGRMLAAMQAYQGRALWILSGDDLVAAEFLDTVHGSPQWQSVVGQGTTHTLEEANHTFSSAPWRNRVSEWTLHWVRTLDE
ncbi:MAG: hydrolase 1, exosortase A system-associated [Gammaproteobacteria bacterium]